MTFEKFKCNLRKIIVENFITEDLQQRLSTPTERPETETVCCRV